MPLINGLKMACEPCIRGHRSTKCTHANERLMVPVRKPGRPLSACPHSKDQPCNCGSVTAAIPRKQACHCGTDTPVSTPPAPIQRVNSISDPTSPTQLTFKIQKTASKPQSSRKQSFDPVNLERMDLNQVNIVPFDQHTQRMQIIPPNAYHMSTAPQPYGYGPPQYSIMQQQYGTVPVQLPPPMHGLGGPIVDIRTSGFTNGLSSLDQVVEDPLETPTEVKNGQITPKMNGGSCCAPSTPETPPHIDNVATSSGSCCAPKHNTHSHTSSNASTMSEPPQATPKPKSCCSSKKKPSSTQNSQTNTPMMNPQIPQNGFPMNNAIYSQYPPTVFTYPATYGSYQNPLQPSAWRQGVHDMSYGHVQGQPSIPNAPLTFDPTQMAQNPETVHTCGCGDGCQCVGCAAHPYNDATRQYVLSAWESMRVEPDLYSNGHSHGRINSNGNIAPTSIQTQDIIKESPTSPPPATPSSTTSGTVEEQSLSASDFFFVNYPFNAEDGCGGETQSCPCGDDCQCLGCTIHRVPDIPCPGEKDTCPCGDDCACIGCTIHSM
ncbi:putative copper fist dna binding domain-containing protein [Botrytis fragariae]|uniref:Putative copper fist dna binding domain-containing protein n=1 Tax=Botrytis fragariae TaxID=1964551 RepID=A0A8H6AHZ5_9HELO|nr:putative copper fist dna binding domain-containing protein [Botrytis fragariae]KAF5867685.1 putative copper fist dna binding domain-containing protein [Botrytis fragariae]